MNATNSTATGYFRSTLLRATCGLALAIASLLGGGCASMSGDGATAHGLNLDRDLSSILAQVPAPEIVRPGQELDTANALAAAANATSGAKDNHKVQAYWGVGSSMEPLYATHTAIVVNPCDFSELRKGMMVLYRDSQGWGIAHVLVEQTAEGWTAQGVNCAEEDPELVTPMNVVGVVTHAYATAEPEGRKAMIAALRAKAAAVATVAPTLSTAGLLAYQPATR
jgi:hypothetical protein